MGDHKKDSEVVFDVGEDVIESSDYHHDDGHGYGDSHDYGSDHHDHSKCGEQGHSHDKGHTHGKGNKWYQSHGIEIKSFVTGLIFIAWFSVFVWFCEPLTTTFDVVGSKVAMSFFSFMCAYSYYICTSVNNTNPTKNMPVHTPPFNSATCKTCSFWKPERTHHCSACNACVLKMDHHCPWIVNCVGFKNHKAFVLFGLYLGLGSIFFGYRGVYYLLSKIDDETFYDLSLSFLIIMTIFGVIICLIGIMVSGLSLYHITLAFNNLTTLESMGGTNMRGPCDTQAVTEKKIVNKYDRGMLANLYEFFGETSLWWWVPTVPATIHQGQNPILIEQPNPVEALDFMRGKTNEETAEERVMKPRTLAEVDLDNIFKIAEEFTKDKHMQFYDRILEIGKRNDNTYRKPEQKVDPQKINHAPDEADADEDSEAEQIEDEGSEKKEDREEVLVVDESGNSDKKEDEALVGAI